MGLEDKYGTGFGSKEVVTKYVWKLLCQPETPENSRELAYALAWANSCYEPDKTIADQGVASAIKEYGSTNFLYVYVLEQTRQKGNFQLADNLENITEIITEKLNIEPDHVPESFRPGAEVRGFTTYTVYEVFNEFWKAVDRAGKSGKDEQDAFFELYSVFDRAMTTAHSVEELRNYTLPVFTGYAVEHTQK